MKIKYVGLKTSGESAFSERTGITWMPGDSHEVADEHAALMLNHPDVFAKDGDSKPKVGLSAVEVKIAEEIADIDPDAPMTIIQLPDGSPLALDGMSKEDLHALAKLHNVSVHHSAGAAKVIDALQAQFPVKPA